VSDRYRTVTAKLKGVRTNSIFVERPRASGDASIPRSLIHAADDLKLDRAVIDEEITFRLRAWKAEEIGLAD